MKRHFLIGAALLWSALAFAVPSRQDVESAVKAGDYPRAESMMREVVAADPRSARAHYVYAEVLAHESRFDDAAAQARQARELDPKIGFTDPAKFGQLEQRLQREQSRPATSGRAPAADVPAPAPAPYERAAVAGGTPGWVWALGFAAVAFVLWRVVSRRAGGSPAGVPAGYGAAPAGYAPGYGPGYGQPGYGPGGYPPGAAPGGGLMRTGLAAAGGVAAGMLAEHLLEEHRDRAVDDRFAGGAGGPIPGVFDDDASRAAGELGSQPIDFGGGAGWDDGGSGGGGGGGSSDDGGW